MWHFRFITNSIFSCQTLNLLRIMQDLEIAKKQLYDKNLTLAIVKNGIILLQTDSHRISGVIGAIEKIGVQLNGASAADRVAGKALAVFEDNKIMFECKEIIDDVLDTKKTSVCPFEKIAADISDPKESYAAFKALLEKMKPCR